MKREISRSQEMNRTSIPANIPFEGINMGFDYQTDAYGNPLTGDMLTRMVDMMGDQLMTPSSENAEISHNAVSETVGARYRESNQRIHRSSDLVG